jgi:hypothetical protein
MTEEELNQIKAVSFEAARSGAREGAILASLLIARYAFLIAILIWLFFYDGFSKVIGVIASIIRLIILLVNAMPEGSSAVLVPVISILSGIFVIAVTWAEGKEKYDARKKQKNTKIENWQPPAQEWHITPTPKEWPPAGKVDTEKLKSWREYK